MHQEIHRLTLEGCLEGLRSPWIRAQGSTVFVILVLLCWWTSRACLALRVDWPSSRETDHLTSSLWNHRNWGRIFKRKQKEGRPRARTQKATRPSACPCCRLPNVLISDFPVLISQAGIHFQTISNKPSQTDHFDLRASPLRMASPHTTG